GDGRRGEVVHALERDVDLHVALAGQRVRHADRDARLHRLHALVEIVDVDVHELAVIDRRQRLFRVAGEVGQHAHHERDLHLLLGAIDFDVVLDLYARGTVAWDEFLTAWLGNVRSPLGSGYSRLGGWG